MTIEAASFHTVTQLVARRAAAADHPALRAPQRTPLTYRQLHTMMTATVAALNRRGIGRGDRVAVVLPNGPEMAGAFLAVAAGASCAPLNPHYSEQDFEFYLSDLNARALLIQQGMDSPARGVAQRCGIPVLELAPRPDQPAGYFTLDLPAASLPPPGDVDAHDEALVLHTSGTTARPKIVPLTHANLCASANNIVATLALDSGDSCLNVMPLFHIHGLMACLLASLAGGGSVICTPGFDAAAFPDWLSELQPTWYSAVPTIHMAALDAVKQRPPARPAPLRFIRSSSAALAPAVMQQVETCFGVPLIEAYGMTEAAHQMASNPLPPRARKPGSVGPAAGPEIAIMNEAGQLLEPGATGEVVIRGDNVTRGYDNNAAANASAYSHGWFRTGDQGRLDQDGYLFLSGRLKEIINRGGEKVSPREIDEALLEHPQVAQAIAFAVPHVSLGEDVAAAVVLKPGASIGAGELRQQLFGRIADFKIPSQLFIVSEIPKGPTGKLQRIGLADKLAPQMTQPHEAPANELEALLAGIFAEVLGVTQVGRHDNFFALGGNSLQGAQAIARIRGALHLDLPITELFRKPTVHELAAELGRHVSAEDLALIGALLADIEHLSDDEVRRLLDSPGEKP